MSARGVAVEVFIVGLLSLGSLRERSEPFPPLVHPSGETATREPCEAALGLMAEQGEWSGPSLNARRGGFRRAATVTLLVDRQTPGAVGERVGTARAGGEGAGARTPLPRARRRR